MPIVPLTRITWVVMISLLGNLLVINQDKRPFLKSLHAPTRSASGAPYGGFLKKIVLDFTIVDAAATRGYHFEARGG